MSGNQLRELRGAGAESDTQAIKFIIAQRAAVPATRGARGVRDADPTSVNLTLERDATQRIRDPHGTDGVILTGTWILHYARLIRLEPVYERVLAGYVEQAKLYTQLDAVLDGAMALKDKKAEVLEEMVKAQQQRGDLYKTLAEIERGGWFERVLRKIAFPAGLSIGLLAGAVMANR